jgi:hypothetical protein
VAVRSTELQLCVREGNWALQHVLRDFAASGSVPFAVIQPSEDETCVGVSGTVLTCRTPYSPGSSSQGGKARMATGNKGADPANKALVRG